MISKAYKSGFILLNVLMMMCVLSFIKAAALDAESKHVGDVSLVGDRALVRGTAAVTEDGGVTFSEQAGSVNDLMAQKEAPPGSAVAEVTADGVSLLSHRGGGVPLPPSTSANNVLRMREKIQDGMQPEEDIEGGASMALDAHTTPADQAGLTQVSPGKKKTISELEVAADSASIVLDAQTHTTEEGMATPAKQAGLMQVSPVMRSQIFEYQVAADGASMALDALTTPADQVGLMQVSPGKEKKISELEVTASSASIVLDAQTHTQQKKAACNKKPSPPKLPCNTGWPQHCNKGMADEKKGCRAFFCGCKAKSFYCHATVRDYNAYDHNECYALCIDQYKGYINNGPWGYINKCKRGCDHACKATSCCEEITQATKDTEHAAKQALADEKKKKLDAWLKDLQRAVELQRARQEDVEWCHQQPKDMRICKETEACEECVRHKGKDCEDSVSVCTDGNAVCYQSHCWAKHAQLRKQKSLDPDHASKQWTTREACSRVFGYSSGTPDERIGAAAWFKHGNDGGECVLKGSMWKPQDSSWERLSGYYEEQGFGYKSGQSMLSWQRFPVTFDGGIWKSTCINDWRCRSTFYDARLATDNKGCDQKYGSFHNEHKDFKPFKVYWCTEKEECVLFPERTNGKITHPKDSDGKDCIHSGKDEDGSLCEGPGGIRKCSEVR